MLRSRRVWALCCCVLALSGWTGASAADCDDAKSTAEINACADKAFEEADTALNRVYKQALAAVPKRAIEPPYDAKSWEAALRESQRAWLAYRDSECKTHQSMFWGGGSGTSAVVLGCMTEKTKARTKELTESYDLQ